MSLFIDKYRLITDNDWKNSTIGQNLLIGSRTFHDFKIYGSTKNTSQEDTDDNTVVISENTIGNSIQKENLPSRASLSWSICAKADTNDVVLHTELNGGGGNTEQAVTQEWRRYSFHGMSNSNGILFFWKVAGSGKLYLKLPKVEYGLTSTQWSPAPQDFAMKTDLINLQDQINQLQSQLGGGKA